MLPLHLGAIYRLSAAAVEQLLAAHPDGAAEHDGVFEWLPLALAAKYQAEPAVGDQLVAVAGTTVKGADFDACLGAIQASSGAATRLVFFRGPAPSLYGSLGASDEWMAEFMGKHASAPASAPAPAPAESA